MKTKYIYLLMIGFFALMSCADEDRGPILDLQKAASLHNLSQTAYTFDDANKDAAFNVSWDEADYDLSAVVNYNLILKNVTADKSIVIATTGENKFSLTNLELNAWMAQIGGYPGQKSQYSLLLTSTPYEGAPDAASNTLTFEATPFDPNATGITWKYAYIAVGYPDWDYTTAYMIGDPDGDGIFEGYANFTNDAATYAILDGSDVSKVLAKDKTVEKKGFYQIVLKGETVEQTGEALTWGIVGDATSGGWDKDTQMSYDVDTRLWTVVTPLLEKEFKFRANNNWGFNFGPVAGKESELSGGLITGGGNFKVLKGSPYIITLNLTNAGNYSYTMEETEIELSSSEMSLPGSYQGWAPESDNCFKLLSAARDFVFTGTHLFPVNTDFKLWDAGTWIGSNGAIVWNATNTSGTFTVNKGGGDNIGLGSNQGYFRITVNMKKMSATIDKTGWEIIGSATPGDWSTGTLMNYNSDTQLWTLETALKDGELKFRWDAAWAVNLGGSLDGLTQDGANIVVTAGTYSIVLDPVAKTATITKK